MDQDQQDRIEVATEELVRTVDADYLRKIQGIMHRCSARCCDDREASMETTHKCIQNCSVVLSGAQNYVQDTFSASRNRLHRCILDCNDDMKDQVSRTRTDEEFKNCKAEFDKCAIRCVDKHIDQVPALLKRMREVLEKYKQQSALYYPADE